MSGSVFMTDSPWFKLLLEKESKGNSIKDGANFQPLLPAFPDKNTPALPGIITGDHQESTDENILTFPPVLPGRHKNLFLFSAIFVFLFLTVLLITTSIRR